MFELKFRARASYGLKLKFSGGAELEIEFKI